MTARDELSAILDRIANGEEAEGDMQALRQLLRAGDRQNIVQLGKYNVNIGEGKDIQIGDRIYQGASAEAIREVISLVLAEHHLRARASVVPSTKKEY